MIKTQQLVDSLLSQWLKRIAETEATTNAEDFCVAVDREVKTMNLYIRAVEWKQAELRAATYLKHERPFHGGKVHRIYRGKAA